MASFPSISSGAGTSYNGRYYFTATRSLPGMVTRGLFSTDGTVVGTRLVLATPVEQAGNFIPYNGKLYFTVKEKIWMTDGTAAAPTLLKTITPGTPGGVVDLVDFTRADDKLYFNAIESGVENPGILWESNGTTAGTRSLAGSSSVFRLVLPGSLRESNNKLHFLAPFELNPSVLFRLESSTNLPPVAPVIADQTIRANEGFVFNIPAFTDPEGELLTYRVDGYPAGFSYFTTPAPAGRISGQTPDVGTNIITVTATDPGGLSVSTTFLLIVNPGTSMGSFAITGATTVGCTPVAGQPNRRSLTFMPQYSGVNGQPISFSVVNEMLPTTAPGPYTIAMYIDNPIITLKARQTGTAGEATFAYSWLAVCGTTPPMPGAFAITGVTTVGCTPVAGQPNRRSLTFMPQYSGLNGSPISFSVVNEMPPTTAPGPYTIAMYIDNPNIILKAKQTGTPVEATFAYNWLAVCGSSARLGTSEPGSGLVVKVLGSPVLGERVEVEIRGAADQPLTLTVHDMQGYAIDYLRVEQAGGTEKQTIRLGRMAGTYLLKVSSPTQKQTVRLLRE